MPTAVPKTGKVLRKSSLWNSEVVSKTRMAVLIM
jgi:hypothetical protein